MKRYILMAFVVFLVSCFAPGMPGSISQSVADFDKSRTLHMEPAWICKGSTCPLKMGLTWNSNNPELISMDIIVPGATLINKGESLHFKIDGEITSFTSVDLLTNIKTVAGTSIGGKPMTKARNISSKRYIVPLDFAKNLVVAENVIVKIDTRKGFIEAIFSTDGTLPYHARTGLRVFLTKITE